jgi:hypothetical protein
VPSSAAVTVATCATVISAVTLSCTPSAVSCLTTGSVDTRPVVVTGTLTYTFGPHEAIVRACRTIPSASSAKTSNEIGRSVMASRTLRAKPS